VPSYTLNIYVFLPERTGINKLLTPEPFAKLPLEAISKSVLCHPERSEGSQPFENTRFFASLRMTYQGKPGF
jgi:hypothetical protein